jgi:hypothetical protein
MLHKRVIFHGDTYWLHADDGKTDMLISPLHHYSDTGELLANPFTDVSFAGVFGDEIRRFGKVIGHLSDLVDPQFCHACGQRLPEHKAELDTQEDTHGNHGAPSTD